MEITLTNENFQKEVMESTVPVLIDFWAGWCGPCMMMGPVVAETAKELEGKVKVGKVNVDEQPELAQKYGIMSIPTFMVFRDGEIAAQDVGGRSKEALKKLIGSY
ncbi:MAG: thioredoxin [Treponema sp.]|jgi:thioredoxin 1|nr:thioredoxin [Treponema sp.]